MNLSIGNSIVEIARPEGGVKMKLMGVALLLLASFCSAQQAGDFLPSATNVWDADYPRVDSTGRVEIRVKAPMPPK